MGKEISTRNKTPSQLVRDQVLRHYRCEEKTTSPKKKRWPSRLVGTLATRLDTNRMRIHRWLDDPDRYPLSWSELQEAAAEVGGSLRALFSFKH
jgi:hypothetical protein